MTVHADATRLRNRINQITQAIRFAPYALSEVAVSTIGDVSENALSRLAGREDQVGFDLAQFLENIRQPGPLTIVNANGRVGILHEPTMGTLEDFEAIANLSKGQHLWHQHTGSGEEFKKQVFDYPDIREEVAKDRQSVWAGRTPQWYLMENGFSGGGEYPTVPAAHFIDSATRGDRIALKFNNMINRLFRGIPRR